MWFRCCATQYTMHLFRSTQIETATVLKCFRCAVWIKLSIKNNHSFFELSLFFSMHFEISIKNRTFNFKFQNNAQIVRELWPPMQLTVATAHQCLNIHICIWNATTWFWADFKKTREIKMKEIVFLLDFFLLCAEKLV